MIEIEKILGRELTQSEKDFYEMYKDSPTKYSFEKDEDGNLSIQRKFSEITEKINLKDVPVDVRTLIKNLKKGNSQFSAKSVFAWERTQVLHKKRMDALKYIKELNLPFSIYEEYETLWDYEIYVEDYKTEERGKEVLNKYFK